MSDQKSASRTPTPKPVLAKVTPAMSKEQVFKNVKAALVRSGFTFKDDDRTHVKLYD